MGGLVGKCQVLCISEGSGIEELLQAAGGGAEGGLEGEAFPLLSWPEEDGAANAPFLPLMVEEEDACGGGGGDAVIGGEPVEGAGEFGGAGVCGAGEEGQVQGRTEESRFQWGVV